MSSKAAAALSLLNRRCEGTYLAAGVHVARQRDVWAHVSQLSVEVVFTSVRSVVVASVLLLLPPLVAKTSGLPTSGGQTRECPARSAGVPSKTTMNDPDSDSGERLSGLPEIQRRKRAPLH